nr:TDP-N-acetylfucosamine:lipid II N-acetylfucosaminyltransferase [uncultured Draconibacterium sp.]
MSDQANFINQIVSFIKEKHTNFHPSTLTPKKLVTKETDTLYEQIINFKISLRSILFYLKYFPRILIYSIFSLLILLLNYRQGLKSIKCVFDAYGYIGKIQHAIISDFDLINIHYCTVKKSISILLLPKSSKIVLSFWGSDLFRTNGLSYNFWLRKALKRANTIHISSFEMRTSLLSEFGHELAPKIKFALFIPPFEQIQKINTLLSVPDKIDELKTKYKIKSNRCIMIGNNASRGNNHIEILDAIKDIVLKYNASIILPLTYSKNDNYLKQLKNYVHSHNIDAILLTEYLTNTDMAALKLISDIFITMQETDAMSAFFTESLYAETICIAASWLPYSTFKNSGVHYYQCPQFESLGELTENILENFNTEKQKCKNNPSLVASTFYDKKKLLRSWEEIYEI